MNVIPFPRPAPATPASEPLAFAIGARVDLRVGVIAAGIVRPRGTPDDAFSFSNLARVMRAARMTWKERAPHAGLSLALPSEIQSTLEADLLSDAVTEAGCTRRLFSFELCERQIIARGPTLAEDLRARGWSVALRGDPECPLPFGARARSLYNELIVQTPDAPDPYLALEGRDRTPLGRRILAAKGAGIVITAESVRTATQARVLALAGFDRGGGPFAEAGLR